MGTEENNFSSYIMSLRREKDVSMEELCRGICSKTEISKVENNHKFLSKLIQDTIISRLGACVEDSEIFLGYKEYDAWYLRTEIIHNIMCRNYNLAQEKNENYYVNYAKLSNLDMQFYLRMKSFIMQNKGESKKELCGIIEAALMLSVPEINNRRLKSLILSPQELDMLLDQINWSNISLEGKKIKYAEIIEYIRDRKYEKRLKARILPKAVFMYTSLCIAEEDKYNILRCVNEAMEALRDAYSSYYLIELIDNREKICKILGISNCDVEDVNLDYCKLRENLISVYRKYEFPIYMENSAVIYLTRCVSCYNDVIRIRRKMLGMSQSQLVDGICDIKTISRIENRKSTSQREVINALMKKLNLPQAYLKNEIAFNNNAIYQRMEEYRVSLNQNRIDEAKKIYEDIVRRIGLESIYNMQFLSRSWNIIKRRMDLISWDEFREASKKLLELTIPYGAMFEGVEKYYTLNEMYLISDLIVDNNHDNEKILKIIYDYYTHYVTCGLGDAFLKSIEFFYGIVESVMGNCGRIKESDECVRMMIISQLNNYRISRLERFKYSSWWNHREECSNNESVEILTQNLIFSRFTRDEEGIRFVKEKIEELKEYNIR